MWHVSHSHSLFLTRKNYSNDYKNNIGNSATAPLSINFIPNAINWSSAHNSSALLYLSWAYHVISYHFSPCPALLCPAISQPPTNLPSYHALPCHVLACLSRATALWKASCARCMCSGRFSERWSTWSPWHLAKQTTPSPPITRSRCVLCNIVMYCNAIWNAAKRSWADYALLICTILTISVLPPFPTIANTSLPHTPITSSCITVTCSLPLPHLYLLQATFHHWSHLIFTVTMFLF